MKNQAEREKAGKRFRLLADSTRHVRAKFLTTITSYQGRVELHGRKLLPGPALNAIVMAWLALPKDERAAFLLKGVRAFERHTSTEGASVADDGE